MRIRPMRIQWAALALVAPLVFLARAEAQPGLPKPLQQVDFEQRLGEQVPLDLVFRDHTGASTELASLFGSRPVILALVYYECPMLCTMILNGLTSSLGVLDFTPGKEYDVIVASFDPREGPEQAARARTTYLNRFDGVGEEGWSFLTGGAEEIARLTEAVGFRYTFDESTGEFAHTAGLVIITPQGRIARYFYGVEYPPRYVRLGLIEASEESIGSLVDRVLLYCFRYDPSTGRYSAVVMNIVRVAALATLLVVGMTVAASLRRERFAREA